MSDNFWTGWPKPIYGPVETVEEERGEAFQPIRRTLVDVWVVSLEPLDLTGELSIDVVVDENIVAIYSNETDAKRCADLFLYGKRPTVTHMELRQTR